MSPPPTPERSRPQSRNSEFSSHSIPLSELSDSDDDNMDLKSRTLSHPLGKILLNIQAHNIELAKKMGMVKNRDEELQLLCQQFDKAMKYERQKTKNKLETNLLSQLENTSGDIETSILNKELNYCSINQAVCPPTRFSAHPTLTNAQKLGDYLKLFPIKSNNKFSGSPTSNVNIFEFLNSLNQAQEIANLSEDEFMTALLRSCTGKAYALVANYLEHQYSLEDIYSQLILLFDFRLSPQEAKRALALYRAPKGSNLTRITGHVMTLATRVASGLPKGPSRTALFDLEGCQSLIGCLPSSSSILANNLYNALASRLGKAPTFCQLTKLLSRHHDIITQDVLAHGHSQRANAEPRNPIFRAKTFSLRQNTASNSTRGRNYNSTVRGAGVGINKGRSAGPVLRQARINNINHNGRVQNNNNNKSYNNNKGKNPRGNNFRNNTPGVAWGNQKYCSLCGKRGSHNAADGCFSMKNDKGENVQVIPSFTHCPKCESTLQRRLFHPVEFCPLRFNNSRNQKKV